MEPIWRRAVGRARPFRGLLAGLPGRGPTLGVDSVRAINGFANAGASRPDAAADDRCRSRPSRSARAAGRPTVWSASGTTSSSGRSRPTSSCASEDPDRIRKIDATLPADEVLAAALEALADLL